MGSGLSKHPDELRRGGDTAAATATPTSPVVTKPTADNGDNSSGSGGDTKNDTTSGCPMHNADGSYSFDWKKVACAIKTHAAKGVKPTSEDMAKIKMDKNEPDTGNGGCPVKNDAIPVAPSSNEGGREVGGGGCPVKHDATKGGPQYNVYGQEIDPSNQMPTSNRNQLPAPTQKSILSTERVSSNIPKGNSQGESTWTYPSPQMFYNALVRKNKAEAIDNDDDDNSNLESDMSSVVALHNHMNEKTWRQVAEWEKQIHGGDVKLLKFQGRPHDLSPKAWIKHYVLGHPLPYDRHDWVVLRPQGDTVRYVMDYYFDDTKAQTSESSAMPSLDDPNEATSSLLVDVRPAIDSPFLLFHRVVTMPYKVYTGQTQFEYLPLRASSDLQSQVPESIQVWQSIQKMREEKKQSGQPKFEPLSSEEIKTFVTALEGCQSIQARLAKCADDDDACQQKASLDYTMCLGRHVCYVQQQALTAALVKDDDSVDHALESLTNCVAHQTGRWQAHQKSEKK